MLKLNTEISRTDDPWRSVRHFLYILWLGHFFICSWATVYMLPLFFEPPFGIGNVAGGIVILVIDGLYIRQIHLYAMGKLQPRAAVRMQSAQCLMAAVMMLLIYESVKDEFFGFVAFLYCLPLASTFLMLLFVSLWVMGVVDDQGHIQTV